MLRFPGEGAAGSLQEEDSISPWFLCVALFTFSFFCSIVSSLGVWDCPVGPPTSNSSYIHRTVSWQPCRPGSSLGTTFPCLPEEDTMCSEPWACSVPFTPSHQPLCAGDNCFLFTQQLQSTSALNFFAPNQWAAATPCPGQSEPQPWGTGSPSKLSFLEDSPQP